MSSNPGGWPIRWTFAVSGLYLNFAAAAANLYPGLPKTGLTARELAVVVNENDPMSVRIGEYYRNRRGIPNKNFLRIRLPSVGPNLPRETFKGIREDLLRQTGPHIQAYALAWTRPYRVDCMSITSAVAFGFDEDYCSAKQCAATKASAYFNSPSLAPQDDHQIRPAMLLAGQSFEEVKRLIDRGVSSDHAYPDRTGYLLNTSDKSRSVRSVFFDDAIKALGGAFRLVRLDADSIKDKKDVLFYFTGSKRVDNLPSLRFVPGAMADHLTSAGGVLDGDGQMSILRWLEAGATASFGTVAEPCNHLQKFPLPTIAMWRYAEGNTLIEAYWKSVAWPGEGLFIGEPLARPFAPKLTDLGNGRAKLNIFSPQSRNVTLEESESPIGPYRTGTVYPINPGPNEVLISLPRPGLFYRIAFPR